MSYTAFSMETNSIDCDHLLLGKVLPAEEGEELAGSRAEKQALAVLFVRRQLSS